ncbi:HTH-type transcriptional regulator/antitoxin MqsA [Methylomarinovum caldicuralii]|uniref:HTH-type transcriptional regulator/antitoxin MqsA n=1 Tax=Methylomarinovum caldicuralii TaxID=438856 RepID=A0AAU9CQA5_9GAMM|nr:type II toxin-antitoxin system MqsA family antitoxin [Methylomarinovum caldicuralii]BCX81687.1 HTH-type transcriptional regulator/antitoxin MqsA [Methylomarinovum caldicuralii]
MNRDSVCPLCGGDKTPGYTTITIDLASGVIVVRKVPAQVCQQCGESWIGQETARHLEKLIQEARKKAPEIEVLNWPDAA